MYALLIIPERVNISIVVCESKVFKGLRNKLTIIWNKIWYFKGSVSQRLSLCQRSVDELFIISCRLQIKSIFYRVASILLASINMYSIYAYVCMYNIMYKLIQTICRNLYISDCNRQILIEQNINENSRIWSPLKY